MLEKRCKRGQDAPTSCGSVWKRSSCGQGSCECAHVNRIKEPEQTHGIPAGWRSGAPGSCVTSGRPPSAPCSWQPRSWPIRESQPRSAGVWRAPCAAPSFLQGADAHEGASRPEEPFSLACGKPVRSWPGPGDIARFVPLLCVKHRPWGLTALLPGTPPGTAGP